MRVRGSVSIPGDKSITHRALFLAAMANGPSTLTNPLSALDTRATAALLRALGVEIGPLRRGTVVRIRGRVWQAPTGVLYCGNSGTSARLSLGALAGSPFRARLSGDRSLRRRPMRRVVDPLRAMGVSVEGRDLDHLPLTIQGGPLRGIAWELPASSAQLKSALFFAGLRGGVPVRVREPGGRSRDHTERMLRSFGYSVSESADGWIDFQPTGRVQPLAWRIPGDFSSAAFLIGLALLASAGELRLRRVGVNPTRTGMLRVLERMGARIDLVAGEEWSGEPVADLLVRPTPLVATRIAAEEAPSLIDEIPMLAVLASQAEGTTTFESVGELRVKESNRLALLASNPRALGAEALVDGDTLQVTGSRRPPRGPVATAGDHRLAMAFAVLGAARGGEVQVDDLSSAAVSYPDFVATLQEVTA